MRGNPQWVPLALSVAAAVGMGCGGSAPQNEPVATAQQAAKPAAAPIGDALEQQPLIAEYTYQPVGKRDPFRSYFDNTDSLEIIPMVNEDCGLLCQFEVDQLRVVAVVSGVASPLAMIEDPDGRGHMVRRGNPIGKRSGKISEIRRDRVVITELLRNQQGQVIPVETEMLIRSKDGKDRPGNQVVDLSMSDAP